MGNVAVFCISYVYMRTFSLVDTFEQTTISADSTDEQTATITRS